MHFIRGGLDVNDPCPQLLLIVAIHSFQSDVLVPDDVMMQCQGAPLGHQDIPAHLDEAVGLHAGVELKAKLLVIFDPEAN